MWTYYISLAVVGGMYGVQAQDMVLQPSMTQHQSVNLYSLILSQLVLVAAWKVV